MPPEEIDPRHWHVLTQSIGAPRTPEPEIVDLIARKGDLLLLCSDGLTDMVSDSEIEEIFAKNLGGGLDGLAESLIEAANNNGGFDNITVVVVEIE